MTTPLAVTPFSAQIREASHEAHTEAENSSFMSDMLGGKLGIAAFRRYTEQLWFVYRALEGKAASRRAERMTHKLRRAYDSSTGRALGPPFHRPDFRPLVDRE